MNLFPKHSFLKLTCLFGFLLFIQTSTFGQEEERDSTEEKNSNIFKRMMKVIQRNPSDSAAQSTVLNVKGETQFLPYKKKVIRHIIIQSFGFEKAFTDTSSGINYFGTKVLNYLHKDTREWVIRDNLFIKEQMPVDPVMLADNERYLRTLEFIQDARILIKRVPGYRDSVDVYVITKDLFSITGNLNSLSSRKFKGSIADANVAGMGQRVQLTSLYANSRRPGFGYELLYSKNNIAGTFINGTAAYTKINPNLANGSEEEKAWYVSFQRPLVSQYSHLAGGLTIGHNKSSNDYYIPDSFYYRYRYNIYDVWVGYNIGVKPNTGDHILMNRFFVSGRYFNNNFSETPSQLRQPYNFRFDSRQALLGQFTFFRQNYYKTNYIYGFGTTEDIPYGYNVAFTGGWYKQKDLSRAYLGIDANRYIATDKGYFIQYFIRTGGFLNNKRVQDGAFLAGASVYSRLFAFNNVRIRQYIRGSYTMLNNRIALDPLRINNPFGLRFFNSDSATGTQRISFHTETFFFLNYKLFGFKFAPFTLGDIAMLTPEHRGFFNANFYYGLGGGVRARNENLVFNTIELRAIYFPRPVDGSRFTISMKTNIRFRYNNNYVIAPDIIQLNSDNVNTIL